MLRYILIAGVNGAGKSTLYHLLRDIQDIPRVNTDEIIKSFGSWKNNLDVMKAGRIAVRKIDKYFNEGISFNQETTLCGRSIFRNIRRAKSLGYMIEVHYVGLDSADIAKERVHQRVLNGGHGISDDDIERRYEESFLRMNQILGKCDLVSFYDNTIQFRRIAIYKDGNVLRQSSNLPDWYNAYFG